MQLAPRGKGGSGTVGSPWRDGREGPTGDGRGREEAREESEGKERKKLKGRGKILARIKAS